MKKISLLIISGVIFSLMVFLLVNSFEQEFAVVGSAWAINKPVWMNSEDNFNLPVTSDVHKNITVALYNSGFLYDDQTKNGIDKDILAEISKRLNIKFDIKVIPRARTYTMLEEGTLPMSVSSVATPERLKYSYYVPYFSQKNYFLIQDKLQIKSEEELLSHTELKVGIVRGYYYGEHYRLLTEKLKEKRMIVEVKDTQELYDALKNGWIQAAINIPSSYLFYFKAMDIRNIMVLDWAPEEEPLVRQLALSRLYFAESDVKMFSKCIDEMKKDGTLYNIYKKYLPEDEAKRMCDF